MFHIRKYLTKEQICTVPNLMSLFRILLVPFLLYFYLHRHYRLTAALVLVSGVTDILDGAVARHFHMVSDFGKMLDPIGDKLTHAALLVCLLTRYRFIWGVLLLLAVKETVMLVLGSLAVRRSDTVQSARWYGKLCTAVLESILFLLILFPDTPEELVRLGMGVCCGIMLFSLLMYVVFWLRLIIRKGIE